MEQPAVLYSDRIEVRSEKFRDCFIDSMTVISGHEEYWTDKIVLMDAKIEGCSVIEMELPDEWKTKLSGRKILLFGFDGAFLMENSSKAIEKLKEAMKTIGEASERIVCLFSPSEDAYGIKNINSGLWAEYSGFIDSLADSNDVIIDYDHQAYNYFDRVSGYYGTPGELAHRCRNLKKPVMLMKIL